MGNPGTTSCLNPKNGEVRWVMVCRSDCTKDAWNVLIDRVFLEP